MSDAATDRAMLVMLAAAALKSDRMHLDAQRYQNAGIYAAHLAIGTLMEIDDYLAKRRDQGGPT